MKQGVILAAASLLAAVVVSAGSVVLHAQPTDKPAEPPPGRVIFVRGDALIEVAGDGKGDERELVKLPADLGPVTSMEASPDAGLIVVRGEKGSAWLPAGETTWRTGCAGRARPSPTNECLICEAGGTITLVAAKQSWDMKIPGSWREANFLGSARELAVLADSGVLGVSTRNPKETRVLAKPGATGYLLVAPDGSKAVAVFGHGAASRVHGLVLDGEGVPRSLGGPAVPVVWSWDSTWALIEYGVPADAPDGTGVPGEEDGGEEEEGGGEGGAGEGGAWRSHYSPWLMAAPDSSMSAKAGKAKKDKKAKKDRKKEKAEPPARVRTCVVRAVGGESKCWNHFAPRGFAPSNDRVLLWKDGALWVGKIPGVRPDPPKRMIEKADGPAIWIP